MVLNLSRDRPSHLFMPIRQSIQGSGGGGKSGGKPSVAGVSGTSNDTAEITLGLCEGQIEGIVGGLKGIYLDETPVQNADGTLNFKDFQYFFLPGTNTQSFTPAGGVEAASETSVSVEVKRSQPVTRTISNNEITAIRIRLGIRLQFQNTKGNVTGSNVRVKILVKEGGGAFVTRINQELGGRFPETTAFSWLIQINPAIDNFTVRVEKDTDDSTDTHIREVVWLSYAEVVQAKIDYINTSVVWMNFPSAQFKSIPSVGFDLAGTLFEIPSNTTIFPGDRGLEHVGNWNGSFYTPALATADPAWIIYGLLTNKRFGLGIDPQFIDKASLYQCSLYNNGAVPNGYGSVERRFTFNSVLQQQKPVIEAIREIASSIAAKPFWNGSQISFWQDRPTSALPRILTNADVEDGNFQVVSQEYNSISTVCKVWWEDPGQEYEAVPEPVENPQAIDLYDVQVEEFTALGETRRGGAVRAGRRVILTGLLEKEQLSCKARAMAIFFQPGDVLQIADSRRNRRRRSGLIVAATTTQITLDAPVDLVGSDRRLFVTLPDLTTAERQIVNAPGSHLILNLASALPVAPLPQSNWQVVDSATTIKQYRILSVTPDRDNPNMHEVSGKLYDESKYSQIENGWALTVFDAEPKPPVIVPLPRLVKAIGRLLVNSNSVSYTLDSQWTFPVRTNGDRESFVSSYIVEFKRDIDGDWGGRQETTGFNASWQNVGTGDFYVRVAAVTIEGRTSEWVESELAILTLIQTVANFQTAQTSIFAMDY
jgi:predicted phage tail protein